MSLEMPIAAEPQPREPEPEKTLSQAYNEHNLGVGAEDKEVAEVRTALEQEAGEDDPEHRGASTSLDEEEGRYRDSQTSAAWEKQNAEELVDALGLDADGFTMPKVLAHYKATDIVAAMHALGMEGEDLENDGYVEMLEQQLNNLAHDEAESGEASEEDTESAEPEKTDEQKTAAEAAAKLLRDQAASTKLLTDLTPDEITSLNTHMVALDARTKAANSPLMADLAVKAMGGILQTSVEQMPVLRATMDALATLGQGQIESTVTRLLNEWAANKMPAVLEHFCPGLIQNFRDAQISNGWLDTLASDEFQGLGLPAHATPEFDKAIADVCAKNPWFVNLDPPGADGKQLPTQEALKLKMQIGARLMAGEIISPKNLMAKIKEATDAGKRSAEKSNRRVSAGRSLKGGRSTGVIGGVSERSELMSAFHGHQNKDMDGIS